MAAQRPLEPLGELEALVMRVAWRHSPATAREVCDRLRGAQARAYTTIMTTMDRLHRKGLLEREKDGLAWRYRPRMDRAEYEAALANVMASRILTAHGEVGLAAFVDAAASGDGALLERLSQLIDARRKEQG